MNYSKVDEAIIAIHKYLINRNGVTLGESLLAPLEWYVNTGRASVQFLKDLARSKPFVIGRRLEKGGSYEDAIARVKEFFGHNA